MAVTRIKNNQITDATIVGSSKLQDYSISAAKIANNLTYGSDLTVTGNLTVQGNVTAVDTVNLVVEDPIIVLAENQTGAPSVDIGFIGRRGTDPNITFVWDESAQAFVTGFTSDLITNTTVTISSYASFVTLDANVTGNISVTGTTTLTGNVSAGNISILSSKNIDVGNNIIGNVQEPVANSDAATKGYVDSVSSSGFTIQDDTANTTIVAGGDTLLLNGTASEVTVAITAADEITFGLPSNVTIGDTLTVTNGANVGSVNSTGNVIAGNLNSNAAVTGTTATFTGNVLAGNVNSNAAVTGTTATFTGNVLAGNLNSNAAVTGTTATFTGNVLAGNLNSDAAVTGVSVTASGNVLGGNINSNAAVTGITGAFTGNVSAGNISVTGALEVPNLTVSGNVLAGNLNSNAAVTGATATFAGNVVAGNLNSNAAVTGVTVTASGNVNGGNINSNNFVGTEITVVSTGNLNLQPTGNIVLNNKYINGVSQPVQDNDAASKIYVDNMVSTQLAYHEAVLAATTGTLATATSGTITYDNGTDGVGATLTTTGAFNLIDTANVQTAGTRILVKNEANAAHNGVYEYTSSTVITRTTDADTYGPNSATDLSINDYFFVQSGNVNAGSAYIVDAPTGVITFGTSNITFAQFSSSQTYSAGNGIVLVGTVITAKVDNDTTAFDGSGNIVVKAGANLTTPNIGAATGTSLNVSGNVLGGNINSNAAVTGVTITASGNLVSGNANITNGVYSATVTASGNVLVGNLNSNAAVTGVTGVFSGNVDAGNVNVTTALNVPNLTVTGNVLAGNLNSNAAVTGVTITASGNITGGNLITSGAGGAIIGSGNITGGNLNSNAAVTGITGVFSGNVDAGNVNVTTALNVPNITVSGNVLAGNLNSNAAVTGVTGVFSGNVDAANLSASTNVTTPNVTSTSGLTLTTGSNGNISLNPDGTGNIILDDQTANRMLFTGANKEVLTNANATFDGANLVITGSATVDNIVLNGSAIDTTGAPTSLTVNSGLADVNFAVNGTGANVFFVDAGTNTASFGSGTQTTGALVAFNANTSILLPVGTTGTRPTGSTGMVRFNTSVNNLEFYDANSWQTAGSQFTVIVANTQSGTGIQTAFTLPQDGTTAGTIVAINGVVQIPVTAYSVAGNVCTFTEAPESTDVIDFRQLTTTSEVGALSGPGGGQVEINATVNEVDITGNLVPTGNLLYNLGDSTNFWKTLYVGGNSIYLGSLILKDNGANTFAVYTADGTTEANIAVGNIDVTSIASGTSTIGIAAPNGNGFITAGGNATFVVTPTGANIAGTLNATGNANVGNLGTSGNITAAYLFGNGSQLSGIDATSIQSGTSAVSVISSGGNIRANVAGATVQTISAGLVAITGDLSVSGNATLSGNILGDRVQNGTTSFDIQTPSGNANITVGATSNVAVFSTAGANITGTLGVSGNITGNYILGNGSQLTGIDATSIQSGTSAVSVISSGGNIRANVAGATVQTLSTGGANVTGYITASGNVTGSYILGNGSLLTGIDATSIQNGSANVRTFLNGNATVSAAGTANVLVVTSTGANIAGTLNTGTGNANVGNIGATTVVATTLTGTLSTAAQTNITSVGALNAGSITSGFGAIDIGTDTITVGGIINANGNGVGNIGSSSVFFNTVFAKATSAQYADLAEKYVADAEYAPGTVVEFGGDAEITLSTEAGSTRVAGVVSTNPSYIMNAGLTGEHVAMVALQGRVPCRVVGAVAKGDLMVAAGNGAARADNTARAGSIIGKALENFDGAEGTIEVVVGRN
jgi:hypothetical protein